MTYLIDIKGTNFSQTQNLANCINSPSILTFIVEIDQSNDFFSLQLRIVDAPGEFMFFDNHH